MSKVMKLFASLALVASLFAFTPSNAEARWAGGWYGDGWHGAGWGWRGGWGGWRGGGWGWGPSFAAGFAPAVAWGAGPAWGWGPGWGNPYWYASAPRCGWVTVRVWRFALDPALLVSDLKYRLLAQVNL
jgi:hypothetical protein